MSLLYLTKLLYNTGMKSFAVIVITICLVAGGIFLYPKKTIEAPLASVVPQAEPLPVQMEEPVKQESSGYHSITLGETKVGAQLVEAVGNEHLAEVLSLNRVDIRHLQAGQIIVIPDTWSDDPLALSSFPRTIPELASVPKMMFIAQREQEFGAYEYGVLVRSGGISTGKKATPTTSKLFYANWKGIGGENKI